MTENFVSHLVFALEPVLHFSDRSTSPGNNLSQASSNPTCRNTVAWSQ